MPTTIKTLIAEDEEPARDRLRQLLSDHPDIEIVGEAGDGAEAIESIVRLSPDLVFLDIRMPGCSGMEVAASLPSPRPRIVFCTAYEEYAVDAFEMHALDYLLKPVTRARLSRTIERVRKGVGDEDEARLSLGVREGSQGNVRFLVRRGEKFQVIPAAQVLFFASRDGISKLFTRQGEYWMDPTLTDLEKRLDPGTFFRVSRSALVQLDAIQEVIPLIGGHGQVKLASGHRLEVSRRRMKDLLRCIQGA